MSKIEGVYYLDSAKLHQLTFNIELKRKELEQKYTNRSELIRWFESHYRIFSKKSAFTCLCCNKPVNMNLTKAEGKSFYFKHNDESECSYSDNTKTYQNQVSTFEDKPKKDVGLTIFREILEGELMPFNAEIERGFHYRKRLSFVPDFIITFPNSDKQWAIDYFTSVNQEITSGSYARHLEKRMKTYQKEGFKSFTFVDDRWHSFLEETNKGTLLSAELVITSKTNEDDQWDEFLKRNITGDLLNFFMEDTGASMEAFKTRNISYVNIDHRLCTIFRFIPTSQNERNITFFKLFELKIPLAHALSISAGQDHFMLSDKNEDYNRREFLKNLTDKKQQFELNKRRCKIKKKKSNKRKKR